MFTFGAGLLVSIIARTAYRGNEKDRETFDRYNDAELARVVALHVRQDLKLIVFLLAAVIVALGVVADRIH